MPLLPLSPPPRLHPHHDALLNEVVSRYLDLTEAEPVVDVQTLALDTIDDHLRLLWQDWEVAAAREVHGVAVAGILFTRHAVLLLHHPSTGTWVGLTLLLETVQNGRSMSTWADDHPAARLRAVTAQVVEFRRLVIADSLTQMAAQIGADLATLADGSNEPRRLRLLLVAILLLGLHTSTGSSHGERGDAGDGAGDGGALGTVLVAEGAAIATVAALDGFDRLSQRVAAETQLVDAGTQVAGVTITLR